MRLRPRLLAPLLVAMIGLGSVSCASWPDLSASKPASMTWPTTSPTATSSAPAQMAAEVGGSRRVATVSQPPPEEVRPAQPPDPAGVFSTSVMTYNILGGGADPAEFPWVPEGELSLAVRLPVLASNIAYADPDIVAVQDNRDTDPLPAVHLARKLAGYEWAELDADTPIAFRREKFELLDAGTLELTEMIGKFVPSLTWAQLRERTNGTELYVFNAHLPQGEQTGYVKARNKCVKSVIKAMGEINPSGSTNFVLTGSFGTASTPDSASKPAKSLAKAKLIDAATIAVSDNSDVPQADSHHGMRAIADGRSQAKLIPRNGAHSDYVIVGPAAQVSTWGVMSGPHLVLGAPKWEGVVASDHSPVQARLYFPRP